MTVGLTVILLRSEQSGLHHSKMKAALLLRLNFCPLPFYFCLTSEPARAAHAAVVAGLAAGLDRAGLLALEELDQLRHGLAYPRELLLARVRSRGHVRPAQPHRARGRRVRRLPLRRRALAPRLRRL